MAQINAELNVKNNMDTYDQMHLITNAKLVLYDNTQTGIETNNLQEVVDFVIVKNKQNVSILTTGWTPITDNTGLAGATYSYTITDADITADSRVDIIFSLESYNNTLGIIPVSDSFDGGVKLYSTEEITNDLVCDYGITKQVVL